MQQDETSRVNARPRAGLAAVLVDTTFRSRAQIMAERLGGVRIIASPSWQPFVDRLVLGSFVATNARAAFVVGPPAAVLRHAASERSPFGFIMPVAQLAKPWQRLPAWRDDATLELWRSGWSPVELDRLIVTGADASYEFTIGHARRTPPLTNFR